MDPTANSPGRVQNAGTAQAQGAQRRCSDQGQLRAILSSQQIEADE
jgi:hypothetical protein